jgi:two-component system, OmpR family, sensor kinase
MTQRTEGAKSTLGRLGNPRAWPVRWRVAAASAGLTLAILLVFAAVIGQLTTQRVRDDFNRELREAADHLLAKTHIVENGGSQVVYSPDLPDFSLPNGAIARVIDRSGVILDPRPYRGPDLGPVRLGTETYSEYRIVTEPVTSPGSGLVGYIQYARGTQHVESTIDRLWLFIAAGVLGGTLLALLAGVAVANRALRPIVSLTATAGEIASTRDTSRRMPEPETDDEVGELAQTLGQMLRSLDAARTEREQALEKQREFVADASHELRTPLTSVIANLELLQASLQGEGSEDREMVDSALRSSQRMTRLVADLLLLARADAGRISERTDCDLAEIVGNAAAEVAAVAGGRRLELNNGHPVPLWGNPDELHRMVLNLLDNAIRHTPADATIELSLDVLGDHAIIEVADDGPGIPEGMREEVFGRFVRGSGPADTASGGGTGLGLAIVRAVAHSHGGEVRAGRSASGGALLTVKLPLARSEQTVTPSLGAL